MKLLTPQKRVNFHGIELWVKCNIETLAADKGGIVYAYETTAENVIAESACHMPSDGTDYDFICKVDLEGADWRETKVSV